MMLSIALALLTHRPIQPGTSLVGSDWFNSFVVNGQADAGTAKVVAATGPGFSKAWQVSTLRRTEHDYDFELAAWTSADVHVGDVVFAQFYVRALKGQAESGEARSMLDFQTGPPGWSKSVSQAIGISRSWKPYQVPFRVAYDSPAGKAMVAFRLGFAPQTVQIADLSVVDLGPNVPLQSLPRTRSTYAGEEAGAEWRKRAEARINKIRKGNLELRIVDAKGHPVKGASVHLQMKRHAFPFGTAVDAGALLSPDPVNKIYQAKVLDLFNQAEIENNLKWKYWETWGKPDGIRAVQWLQDHRLRIRAHNIIWPGWGELPPDLPKLKDDKAAMNERIDRHIEEMASEFKGKVDDWDVVNEPFAQHDVLDILGWQKLGDWFTEVHRIDPKPTLVLNDYPPLDGDATQNVHLNHFYRTIGLVQNQHAPLQAIGFQCHMGSDVVPPERVLSGLDRFAKFGLPIQITEFDVDSSDEQMQAHYLVDFYTAAFSHPAVSEITMWGFWEVHHWLPRAALYRRDWTIKPNGIAYANLVKKHWWTDVAGKTSTAGRFATRGFFGDYEAVVVSRQGRRQTFPLAFPPTAKGRFTLQLAR